jgi:hypothetical protein
MFGLRFRVMVCAWAGLLAALGTPLLAEEPRRETRPRIVSPAVKTPRLDQYDKYYALSIKPDAAVLPHKADAHDIVVVFGTSAMQSGEFRARGMATLRALLDKLNPTDRVCLLAADTSVVPSGSVPPTSVS